jgi:hypothetical protein
MTAFVHNPRITTSIEKKKTYAPVVRENPPARLNVAAEAITKPKQQRAKYGDVPSAS